MAQSKNNIITHGLSGKVGNILVFSQRKGKTIVSQVPKEYNTQASKAQLEQRQKFQQAVLYAQTVRQQEDLKKLYEDKAKDSKSNSYNIAIADLLHAPKIEKIDLSDYTGKKGDTIQITATDDFMVKSVKVIIHNAEGTLIEEGMAKPEGAIWVYKATEDNPTLTGDKITIQATDLPDNLTEETQIL